MKQKSNTRPSKVKIDVINDMAHVSLFDNIKRVAIENELNNDNSDNEEENHNGNEEVEVMYEYEYDHYIVKVINQPNLQKMIQDNFDDWLQMAKDQLAEVED